MDFALSSEQKLLRDQIVRFATAELGGDVVGRDRQHAFSRELWDRCGGMGLAGLPVPEALGGSGLEALDATIALEALGYGCRDGGLVFSLVAHLVSCVVPIWKYGTPEQHERYLADLASGRSIGIHAMTEPDSGSDAFALRTRAEPDGEGFVLNGTKMFITNAPIADLVVVLALTDAEKGYHGGVTAFLVERGTPGLGVGAGFEKMGLRTSPIGELSLADVRVGPEAVLGGVGGGAQLFMTSMDWERVCLFGAHVGTMERLLETSVEYARTRSQFGQAIGKFQAVSHRIADMKVALEAARLLVYRAAWNLGRSRTVTLDAAIAKLFVSESLLRSALDTVHLHGGYGYMTEYEVERALRDAVAATIYSGTSEMQRNLIARWLGLGSDG
jgi:alkylation response protein AidB-like acyl-CoA dehydrogenase